MSHHYDRLLAIIQVCLIVAAVCTTAFPLIWALFPWYKRVFGRLLMLQALSFAIVLDFTALFQFWTPGIMTGFWIEASVFVLIAISSAALSTTLLHLTVQDRKKEKTDMSDTTVQPEHAGPAKPVLSNQLYDALKYIAQIVLPALGTFYFAVAQIWGLPFATKVVGSITAADVFLGVLLGLATTAYTRSGAAYDGDMNVAHVEGVTHFQLNLNSDPADLPKQDKVVFKVNKVDAVHPVDHVPDHSHG